MSHYTLPLGSAEAMNGGGSLIGATPQFAALYEPTDKRKDVTLLPQWTNFTSRVLNIYGTASYGSPGGIVQGCYIGKYRAQSGRVGAGIPTFDNDQIIYRFSDVYLMLAEIYNELEGPGTNAFKYLNELRSRSGASAVLSTIVDTQQKFRDVIYLERVKEFIYEGHVIFDLRRWGRLNQAMLADPRVSGKPTYKAEYELFPIPSTEVLNNPLLNK
jgi:hypothetical protein